MWGRNRIVNRMAFACLASLAIFAGGLVPLSWFKSRRPEHKSRVGKVVEQEAKEKAPFEQLVISNSYSRKPRLCS
jgi:hypothetical protein